MLNGTTQNDTAMIEAQMRRLAMRARERAITVETPIGRRVWLEVADAWEDVARGGITFERARQIQDAAEVWVD